MMRAKDPVFLADISLQCQCVFPHGYGCLQSMPMPMLTQPLPPPIRPEIRSHENWREISPAHSLVWTVYSQVLSFTLYG